MRDRASRRGGFLLDPGRRRPRRQRGGCGGVAEGTAGVGGRSVAALDFAGVDATTGGGGRYSSATLPTASAPRRKNDKQNETLGIHDSLGDRARRSAAREMRTNRIREPGRIRRDGTGGSARPAGPQEASFERAVLRHSLAGILGTTGCEAAIRTEHRSQRVLIAADERQQDCLHGDSRWAEMADNSRAASSAISANSLRAVRFFRRSTRS